MNKISLDQRVTYLFEVDPSQVIASDEQLERIEALSSELTEICDMSPEAANQLIFYSILKWQMETDLNYKEGLVMSYIERVKHKARMFEIGKECITRLISDPSEMDKVNQYIDRKMYQYLARLTQSR